MSPVSPVFHTVVTVKTGLKTQLGHIFLYLGTRVDKKRIPDWSTEPCSIRWTNLIITYAQRNCTQKDYWT